MGNPARKLNILPGQPIKKWIGIAIIACVLASGIFLTIVLILTPTAKAQGNQQMVSIRDFFFSPVRISVPPGTTVTWVNQGNAPPP